MTTEELRRGSESWLTIPDFKGYEVSCLGRVRTCIGRAGTSPLIMRLGIDRKGYKRIVLRRDGKKCTRQVGRLVLLAFVGACPAGMECCHRDGDKVNNVLGNLRWGTKQENEQDKVAHGTKAFGSRHGQAVLNDYRVRRIRELLSMGFSQREIAEMEGVDPATVGCIKRGRTWGHIQADSSDPIFQEPPSEPRKSPAVMRAERKQCPRGHPYSGENLYTTPDGRRDCRACRQEARRRNKERLKNAGR